MILVKPSFHIMAQHSDYATDDPLHLIELAGRTCYKSEQRMTPTTAAKFATDILDRGHESVIEHSMLTVRFIIDRGVSHELVRHRLCAFSQESTRYCNYHSGVTFIIPPWVSIPPGEYHTPEPGIEDHASTYWYLAMREAENVYISLQDHGWTPQQARSVLPNSLKTEIVVTANFREWRHILCLRTSPAAHPQMREVMIPLLDKLRSMIPVVFDARHMKGDPSI